MRNSNWMEYLFLCVHLLVFSPVAQQSGHLCMRERGGGGRRKQVCENKRGWLVVMWSTIFLCSCGCACWRERTAPEERFRCTLCISMRHPLCCAQSHAASFAWILQQRTVTKKIRGWAHIILTRHRIQPCLALALATRVESSHLGTRCRGCSPGLRMWYTPASAFPHSLQAVSSAPPSRSAA